MTNSALAQSCLEKSQVRLVVLDVLMEKGAYSDVVREAQEVVELALKAMLRQVGIEPPKFHDVGGFLLEHEERFSEDVKKSLERLAEISSWLRKEREFAFYGDIDFIPTEKYKRSDAQRAIKDARWVVSKVDKVIPEPREKG